MQLRVILLICPVVLVALNNARQHITLTTVVVTLPENYLQRDDSLFLLLT